MTHRAKFLITVILLLVLLAYFGHRLATGPEWRQFHADLFWQSLLQVRFPYLLLAAALVFGSYFFRSLRWLSFLKPMKAGSVGSIFTSTLIGFSAVALLGRPGEFVRPLLIARKERLPVSSQLGAWTLERVFDSLTMGTMLGAVLLLSSPPQDSGASSAQLLTHLRTGGIVLCGGAVLFGVLLALLRYNAQRSTAFLLWLARWLPERHRERFRKMLEDFSAGLASVESIYGFLVCTVFSLLVWGTLVLAYWSVARAFGGPMARLDLEAAVLLLAITVVGSLLHLPGIGGGTQVANFVALTELFGIPLEIASSAAILFWVLAFLIVLIPGLPLAAREGLTWQRLRSLSKTAV